MTQKRITDDLHALLGVLPLEIADAVQAANNSDKLMEIVLDLGRLPMARFVDSELPLSNREITYTEIDAVTSHIGEFDADNRAGLERTLHRISGIRNRRGRVVGLTCRVGRAVYGTIDIIQDLVESEKSILLLGRPGIGKTTMLREAARILAEKKRVIIVDTSNEIGGDGDVPHPAVGRARRMQVRTPTLQHEVMIEAVENHNPEVIVIDEIGRELEAAAARTIAERGVQLVATAHGRTLENLLLNPTLSDLIGGIESVTLSDEEARRRGTQKTVLERRAPPTFDILVEIAERDRMVIYPDVAAAVDELVRGYPLHPEIRWRDADDQIHVEQAAIPSSPPARTGQRRMSENSPAPVHSMDDSAPYIPSASPAPRKHIPPKRIYAYGVARNRLTDSAKILGVPIVLAKDPADAEVFITLRTYYRSNLQVVKDAENRGTPIYVLRANTASQMQQSLAEIFSMSPMGSNELDLQQVSLETQEAIESVMNGQRYADLPPAVASVRRLQHELARQSQLISHSLGKDPNRHVRIYRE